MHMYRGVHGPYKQWITMEHVNSPSLAQTELQDMLTFIQATHNPFKIHIKARPG